MVEEVFWGLGAKLGESRGVLMTSSQVSRVYPGGYLQRYRIEGCANNDTHKCYTIPEIEPGFQVKLEEFKKLLVDLVEDPEGCKTFYKYGDGDYWFLNGVAIGSATPGRRALSKDYSEIGLQRFIDGSKKCDYYTCELYPENREKFRELLGREPDFPAEFAYGLTANHWLTKTFAGRIGVIGGLEKVETIRMLATFPEYRQYLELGEGGFNDYLTIPERFACDNLSATTRLLGEQLRRSDPATRIYLVGVGHVKSGLLHQLPEYKKAIYLDVGTGLNMLAGCINHSRPYAADWVNYGVKNQSNGSLDQMDFQEGRGVERWL